MDGNVKYCLVEDAEEKVNVDYNSKILLLLFCGGVFCSPMSAEDPGQGFCVKTPARIIVDGYRIIPP